MRILALLIAVTLFVISCATSRWAVRSQVCDREICTRAADAAGWRAVGAGAYNPVAEMCECRMLDPNGQEQQVYVAGRWWTPPDGGAP